MSNTERDLKSWDSDEELLGETASYSFDKDLEKNQEDELLGLTDNEMSFDDTEVSRHPPSTPRSDIILNVQSEEGDDLLNYDFGDDEEPEEKEELFDGLADISSAEGPKAEAPSPSEKFGGESEAELSLDIKKEVESSETTMIEYGDLKMKEEEHEELDYMEEEDEEEEDENLKTRSRFTSERKQTSVRGIAPRPNFVDIPDTLELSKEDAKKIEEFVQQKNQRHQDRRNIRNNNNGNFNNNNNHRRYQQQQKDLPGLLGPPRPALGLHLLSNGVRGAGNMANTIASVVNLMMMDKLRQGNVAMSVRGPPGRPVQPGAVQPAADLRLRAPRALLTTTASSSTHFLEVQPKFGTGFIQLRADSCPQLVNQSRPVMGLHMIGHEVRPVHPQMLPVVHTRPVLSQTVVERPRVVAPMDAQQIQVITRQQPVRADLHSGLFPGQVHIPPVNLSIPPPPHGQMPQTRFIHQQQQQAIRMVVPMNGFVPFRGANPHQSQGPPTFGTNFNRSGQPAVQRAPFGQAVPSAPEMVGRPIETVVLGRAGGKNKPNRLQGCNQVEGGVVVPDPTGRWEAEEAEKLARRAARFSKPAPASAAIATGKDEPVAVATEPGSPDPSLRKRMLSPVAASAGGNPKKVVRSTSNRKVIVKSEGPHKIDESLGVSSSGKGDYKDFELMRGLEKQKKIREMILKKKEESRLMQAKQRRKTTEAAASVPCKASSSLLGKAPTASSLLGEAPVASDKAPISSSFAPIKTEAEVKEVKTQKPMKKVLMTKSQYKALVQHMKTKGISLPKAVREVSTGQAGPSGPTRRVVRTSERSLPESIPRLVPVPELKVPNAMPLPSAVSDHPRFAGSKFHPPSSDAVVLSGLSQTTEPSRLRGLAENIGPVEGIHMLVDEEPKAIIKFHLAQHAQIFAARYNGSTIDYSVVSAVLLPQ